jgi:hypothetical protein
MERWEYTTTVLAADINTDDVRATTDDLFRGRKPPKPTPETLIPLLNAFGEDGWELVSLEHISAAGDHRGAAGRATNLYLAVFKRRKLQAGA